MHHGVRPEERKPVTCTITGQENNDKGPNSDSGAEIGRTHGFEMGSEISEI